MDSLVVLTGFAVGLVVGLTGVGGGALMTPLLIGAFKVSPAIAVGTDLCFAALTKAGGLWTHHRLGHVEWATTGWLLLGSGPAAAAVLLWMRLGSAGPQPGPGAALAWQPILTVTLGVALLLTALALMFRTALQSLGQRLEGAWTERHRLLATVGAGALLGTLVTLSSVGAGAIGAALLLLLRPRLPAQRLVGTDIAHAVPLALLAGAGHATLGQVDATLLVTLLAGSWPGIALGARLTRHLPERWVRSALFLALTTAGIRVLA